MTSGMMIGMAVILLGGLALLMHRNTPLLSSLLVAATVLVTGWILAISWSAARFAFARGPAIVLGRDSFRVAGRGQVAWRDVAYVRLLRVGSEAELQLVAKDERWPGVPLLDRISSLIAERLAIGVPTDPVCATLPYDRMSVSGPHLVEYLRSRYGLEVREAAVGAEAPGARQA